MEESVDNTKYSVCTEEGQQTVRDAACRMIDDVVYKLRNEIPAGNLYREYSVGVSSSELGLKERFGMMLFVDPNLSNRCKRCFGLSVRMDDSGTDRGAYLCCADQKGLLEYLQHDKCTEEICRVFVEILVNLCETAGQPKVCGNN